MSPAVRAQTVYTPPASTSQPAQGDKRPFIPSIGAELLWTSNVALNEASESDFALTLTPRIFSNYIGPRAQLTGMIALPVVVHARNRSQDEAFPEVNLSGRVELVERLFFVEASANVYTTFFDPFGARPIGLQNIVDNRYTAQSYRVTPYIDGRYGPLLRYSLRNENLWSDLGNAPTSTRSTYVNRWLATIDREPTPFGWGADVSRTDYHFNDQRRTQTFELARARGEWEANPQLALLVSGGYERNEVALSTVENAIYGAGLRWRPTDRTLLDAAWEHRFFGGSYRFLFEHRMPMTTWNVKASRDAKTYVESLGALGTGAVVADVLDVLFASRIPDADARAQFITNYISERGLPTTLGEPIAIYQQNVYLVEDATASIALTGVRNAVLLNVYYRKTEPLPGEDVLPALSTPYNDNTQTGATATWSSQLAPLTAVTLTANANRTKANDPTGGTSDQWSLRLALTHRLSPKTTTFAGARYQDFKSDYTRNYDETAVFVGANHVF
jgi:uncharacterized protein (PEP-CTERM system associated)